MISLAVALAMCACRRAEVQTLSDVAIAQRLVFRAPMDTPTAVDIQVMGRLDGSAVLVHRELDKRPVLLRDSGHIPSLRLL